MNTIPNQWKLVRLGDHCSLQNGYPFKSDQFNENEGVPLIRVRSLKIHNCDIKIQGNFDEAYIVNNDDILIGMDGDFQPCLWRGGKALLNQRVCRLRNFEFDLDKEYAYHAIGKPLGKIENSTFYTTVKHLSSSKIMDIKIPLPPLPQQRAIARALRAVQGAREARLQEAALERERKAALMEHLFARNSWNISPLEKCAFVQTGVTKGRKFENGSNIIKMPYLRVANVQDGYLDLEEIQNIEIRESELERFLLQPGDILLTEGGDFDKLGRGFIWQGQIPKCVHQNHIFAVRVDKDRLLPEYLAYLIQSEYGKAYFLSVAHRTTHLACINSTKLKAFPTLIPDLAEQKRIVDVLAACDSRIDALEHEARLHQELFRAMLEELMSGRLPAGALVEDAA